jgi:CDP-diacylglycerol--glycerol-3-phosphate 3-phosphatidyltransferase
MSQAIVNRKVWFMPSVYDLKPKFQGRLRPAVGAMARAGVTPNQVTIAAFVLSAAWGTLIALTGGARWTLLPLPVVLLTRMALNAIDGLLAREHGMQTRLGAWLNELGDVLADAALYLPLGLVPGVSLAAMSWVVVLAVVSEMAGVLGQSLGGQRCYHGPMGKSDRAFVFGALGLALGLGARPGGWLAVFLAIVLFLEGLTIVKRARAGLRAGGGR